MSLTWRRVRGSWLFSALVMLAVVGGVRSAIADWNDVPTGSMKPTILIGDRIAVNKLAYDLKLPFVGTRLVTWGHPERGDVVICTSPADGTRLVKRVVAVPGDVVEMRQSRLLINGEPLAYTAADEAAIREAMGADAADKVFFTEDLTGHRHTVALTPQKRAIRDFGPLAVPAGKFFMMGDNRDNSADSRYWGFVDRDAVAGRVYAVAFSLDYENHWRPRWSRFFSDLI